MHSSPPSHVPLLRWAGAEICPPSFSLRSWGRIILNCLKGDEQVKIAGFGTYKVAKRKARIGRNPRTGEQIQISASQKVKFLPAKALKVMFNK